jgi:hypothetical protein
MADFPKRSNWRDLKKKYKIPDGAAKGIEVGKALDAFHKAYDSVSGPTAPKKRVPIAEGLEKLLADYISAVSKNKKSIKLYDGFEKEFMKDYLGKIHFLAGDLKRYNANSTLYQAEVAKYFKGVMVLKSKRGKATPEDVQYFNQGPQRGLSALGKSVQGIDVRKIDAALGKINTLIQTMPKTVAATDLKKLSKLEAAKAVKANGVIVDKVIDGILENSEDIAAEAVTLGLVKANPL